jgi:hypothetical protein
MHVKLANSVIYPSLCWRNINVFENRLQALGPAIGALPITDVNCTVREIQGVHNIFENPAAISKFYEPEVA